VHEVGRTKRSVFQCELDENGLYIAGTSYADRLNRYFGHGGWELAMKNRNSGDILVNAVGDEYAQARAAEALAKFALYDPDRVRLDE
jgi:hypothetical protein